MFDFHPFHGGLPLNPHKTVATDSISAAFIPKLLIYRLFQRTERLNPVVKVGERVLKGQIIARPDLPGFKNLADLQSAPLHAASSGTVQAIEKRPIPHPSGLNDDCIVIATDGLDEVRTGSPLKDYQSYSATELIDFIQENGIVGLGGAAFPTALKLQSAHKIDTLIINAVECEPFIQCDEALIQQHAADILQAAQWLLDTLHIPQCLIAQEDDKPKARLHWQHALVPYAHQIRLVCVPNHYPSGSEKQLIQRLTGKEVPQNGLPAQLGIVCLNVGTVFAMYQAIYQRQPLLERVVTITGDGVRRPQNRWVKIGTPIAEVVAACGGYTDKAERLIMGGPMMGMALADDAIPVVKSTNCLLISSLSVLKAEKPVQPCIRCGACAQVCPAQLLPQQLYWYGRAENQAQLHAHHLSACIECGCCDVVCPSHIPLTHFFRASKGKILQHNQQVKEAELAKYRYEARQQRLLLEQEEQAARTRKQQQAIEAMKAKLAAKRGS